MPIVEGSVPLALPGGQAQVTTRRPRYSSSYPGVEAARPPVHITKRLRPIKRLAFSQHENRLHRQTDKLAHEDSEGMG